MATDSDFLSTYIEPLAEEITFRQAQTILSTEPSAELVARVHELAEKANAGILTELERAEYEHYVDIDDAIGLLKVKARSLLQQSRS